MKTPKANTDTTSISLWRLLERAVSTVIYCGYFGFLGDLLFDTTGIYVGVGVGLFLYYVWGGVQRHYTRKVRDWGVWKPEKTNQRATSSTDKSTSEIAYEPGYIACATFIYNFFITLELPVWCYAFSISAKKMFSLHPDKFIVKIAPFKESIDFVISTIDPFSAYRNYLAYVGEVRRLQLAEFILTGICVVAGYFLSRIAYSWIVETVRYQSLARKNNNPNRQLSINWRPFAHAAMVFGVFFLFGLGITAADAQGIWILSGSDAEQLRLPFARIRPVELFVFLLFLIFLMGNAAGSAIGFIICQSIGILNRRWRRGRKTTA